MTIRKSVKLDNSNNSFEHAGVNLNTIFFKYNNLKESFSF